MDSHNPFGQERDIACSFPASLEDNCRVAFDQAANLYCCCWGMNPSLGLHTDRNKDRVVDREVLVDVMVHDVVAFDHLDSVSPFLMNA